VDEKNIDLRRDERQLRSESGALRAHSTFATEPLQEPPGDDGMQYVHSHLRQGTVSTLFLVHLAPAVGKGALRLFQLQEYRGPESVNVRINAPNDQV
jgi:hypothetical protein